MTKITDPRGAPTADPATASRRTPDASDRAPTLALLLGAASTLLVPVLLTIDLGPAGILVPLTGLIAVGTATRYRTAVDYSPPGDPVMRRADLGRLLGLVGAIGAVLGGVVRWCLTHTTQLSRLQELFLDIGFMVDAIPTMLTEGLRVTMIVWVIAVVMGQVFGTLLALLRISRVPVIRAIAVVYIDIFRGLPAILTIVLVGFALPLAGINPVGPNPIFKAAFALGLVATAYIGEIVRAGIQSIDEGQMEAARSLGMPHRQAMRLIIIPQGIRRVLPPLTNEYIALLKDTSLIFVVGLAANASSFFQGRDLYRVGQNLAQINGNYSAVVLAGIVYLLLTIPLTRLTNHLDRRLREGRAAADRTVVDDDPLVGGTQGGLTA